MVRRLLGICLGVMFQMGCLLSNPPDYDEPSNAVPVVLSKTPQAPLYKVDIDDYSTEFTVEVRHDDVEETLRHRWYLDYDEESVQCGRIYSQVSAPDGTGKHSLWFEFVHGNGGLTPGKCHQVMVVITDGEWSEEDNKVGCPSLRDDGNRVFVDWYLGVEDEDHPIDGVSFGECLSLASRNPLAETEL